MTDNVEVKVKINKYESYLIVIPKELDDVEFAGMVERFNLIKKTLLKDLSISENIKEKKIYKSSKKYIPETREDALKMLKTHFFGNEHDRKLFLEANNIEGKWYDTVGLNVSNSKKKYSILPIEFGLGRFPKNKWEFINIKNLKIKDSDEDEF